jgi:hypothetical protein
VFTLFRAVLLAGLLAGAAIAEPSIFYNATLGSRSYISHDIEGNLDLPRNFYTTVSYDTYRSDTSGGTFRTYGGEVGRLLRGSSWRLFGSHTPESALYKQTSAGGELTQRILGDRDLQPARPDLTARIRYTRRMHTEIFEPATGRENLDITQNDYLGGLLMRWHGSSLGASYTQSAYNQNLSLLRTPTDVYQPLPGVSSVLGGYTDNSYTLSLSQKLCSSWRAWTAWTHARLKEENLRINSYLIGGGYYGDRVTVTLDYNFYRRTDDPVRHYVSLGLGWEFKAFSDHRRKIPPAAR